MNTKPFIFAITLVFVLSNCKPDENPCPDPYEMGEFSLLESSMDLFPYEDSIRTIIFSDSLGNEVVGSLSGKIIYRTELYSPSVPCKMDEEEKIKVVAKTWIHSRTLHISDLEINFKINYRPSPSLVDYDSKMVADVANITAYGKNISRSPPPSVNFVLNRRTGESLTQNFSVSTKTVFINGIEFNNIYKSSWSHSSMPFYFNIDQGIVAFTDYNSGITYKFERFE